MRRNMIMLLAAALLVVTGCKKDDKTAESEKMTFSAGFDNGSAKTEIDGLDMRWNEGDAVMINGKTFTADKGGASTTLSGEKVYQEGGLYKAYFPASMYDNGTLTLPATQTYNGKNLSGVNPMYAQSESTNLTFSNLCAMVKLQLTGSKTVKEIRVSADQPLSGEFEIAESGSNYKAVMKSQTGIDGVTLDCGDGVGLSSNNVFYVTLPEGTCTNLKFLVLTSDNKWCASIELASVTLTANNLYELVREPVFNPLITPKSVTISNTCDACAFSGGIGGTVTVPSGNHACEFGLVYSQTDKTPSIEEGAPKIIVHTLDDDAITGKVNFTADLGALTAGVDYYVRTYALCDIVKYSSVKTISTPADLPSDWVNGKNPHPFSVGSGKVVYFSQGNLQYTTTGTHSVAGGGTATGTWRFAEHQFDFIGAANANAASTYEGWIDLFGWGTSGWYNGNHFYQPYDTDKSTYDSSVGYGYGPTNGSSYNLSLTGDYANADWGVYNTIQNGCGSSWRTLTKDESNYLFNTRKDGSGNLLWGEGKLGDCTNGVIILPDDWTLPVGLTFTPGAITWSNVYSYSEWALMEAAGAVFLPATGYRDGTSVTGTALGHYWLSSCYGTYRAYQIRFYGGGLSPAYYGDRKRCLGQSVRLVSEN